MVAETAEGFTYHNWQSAAAMLRARFNRLR